MATGNRTIGRCAFIRAAIAAALLALPASASAVDGGYPQASRIVAIGGAVTEIVYALGQEKRLVGRDSTSLYPPESQTLPDVGYMRALSPEGVLSIKPDLIVALEGSGPPEAVSVLANAGIPFVSVPETFDRDGVLARIRAVGAALGVDSRAAELEASVAAELDAAAKRAAEGEHPRVLFILSMQGGRVLASGGNTAADGIIRLAGARNAVEGYEGYKPLNDEAIIAARPDLILMMDRGGDHGATAETLFAHPALAITPAAQGRRLVRMDGNYLLGFGPRTGQAVADLSKALAAKPAR